MIDLKRVIKDKKLTQAELAVILEVTQSYISQVEKGVVTLSEDKYDLLYQKYGEEILKYDRKEVNINNPNTYINNSSKQNPLFINIPVITKQSFNIYVEKHEDDSFLSSLPTVPVIVDDNIRNGRFICVECVGDSMDDGSRKSIYDKDIVLCRLLTNDLWIMAERVNKMFAIVSKKGIAIKQITSYNSMKRSILCHSLNPLYQDYEVLLDDIKELWIIDKIIDRSVNL